MTLKKKSEGLKLQPASIVLCYVQVETATSNHSALLSKSAVQEPWVFFAIFPRNSWPTQDASFAPHVRCASYACGPAIGDAVDLMGGTWGNTGDARDKHRKVDLIAFYVSLICFRCVFIAFSPPPSGPPEMRSQLRIFLDEKRHLAQIQVVGNLLGRLRESWGDTKYNQQYGVHELSMGLSMRN